jgi:hypothetical protein
MVSKKIKVGFPCPSCGSIIQISGEAVEAEAPKDINTNVILNLFTPSVRKDMKITIEGNHALIELGGKYNKNTFNKALTEIKGYGGRWVKGHFVLPLAGMGEGE